MFLKIQKIILLSFLCLFAIELSAQFNVANKREIGYNSQYYFQQTLYNPAFAGMDGQMNFSISHPFRQIDGRNPQHFNLLYQDVFQSFEGGYGLGVVYQDKDSGEDKDRFYLVNGIVSGGFDFGENWIGRAGLTVGLLHYTNAFRADTQTGTQGAAYFKVNLDAGILLKNNNFSIGFSVVQSSEPEFVFSDLLTDEEKIGLTNEIRVNNQFIRAVYLQTMYDINFGDVQLTPMMLLSNRERTTFSNVTLTNNNNNLRMELGANVLVGDIFLGGIHASLFNSNHAVSLMLGARLQSKYQISFSYDVPSSNVGEYRNIELTAGFFFGQ